jgi:hypothetical protein
MCTIPSFVMAFVASSTKFRIKIKGIRFQLRCSSKRLGIEGKSLISSSCSGRKVLKLANVTASQSPSSTKISANAVVLSNGNPRQTVGHEVPDFGKERVYSLKADDIFMAKRFRHSKIDQPMLWGNRHLYSVWDGKPKYFDLND